MTMSIQKIKKSSGVSSLVVLAVRMGIESGSFLRPVTSDSYVDVAIS